MESGLKNKILKWARVQPDVWLHKYHGSAWTLAGHPDVYGHVGGLAVYLELKEPGKKLAPVQEAIGRKIRATGAAFHRVDDFQRFLEIISDLRSKMMPVKSD